MSDSCEVYCFDEEKVSKLTSVLNDNQHEIKKTVAIFKALADETRMKIAYSLSQEEELCVCDVANIIGASTATTSHHLRHLRTIGLAKSRKEGKLVFYSLDDEHVRTLITIGMVHSKETMSREQ
ncbi:ArsR/SmtB family transcription factor [Bacillus alkalicellulosilyticus]|uniref:ArsR/SmtB family transcription factor n=1 Tax=Alkalihalobacterium alkalicellulosilyticum TaxID=1912214 RepID=UPI000996BDA6|nr:metalloregulator ArsR/SmtB family transcription factor [Bacillus alkalicellulosilyticus]